MKKLLILIACCFAFFIYKNQKESQESNFPNMIAQAVQRSDWATAARLSQRVLLEELNPEVRWQALQYTVLASKNLGDYTWVITALENNILDYTAQDKQEYIYTELMLAYKERLNYVRAREAASSLLSLKGLTPEKRASTEISHAEFSFALSDFNSAETMLLSTLSHENTSNSHTQATFMLASLYYYTNNIKKCEKYLDEFLASDHTNSSQVGQALFIKADIAEINENYEEANELYHQALDLHPNPDTINVRLKNLERIMDNK